MQDGLVAYVRDRAEHLALRVGGVGKQRQRLVGVERQHHLVEVLASIAGGDLNPRGPTADRPHPGAKPQAIAEGADEPLHIGP